MNPDLVLLADIVHTFDETPGRHRAPTAVAVQDGHVAAVGTRDDVRDWRGRNTEVIDLGAATLTPGLSDSHTHPVMGLQLTQGVDLSGARDLGDVRSLLAKAAGENPGGWVLAWGLDPNVFGRRQPSAADLEEPLGGRPALILMFDAHSALASSQALDIAGVDGPRRFDQRAQVVCDDAGRPTGLLLEAAAIDLVQQAVPLAPVAERRDALLALLSAMAATGLTSGHVMDMLSDTAALVTAAEEVADLPMRLRFAPWCPPGADQNALSALVAAQGTGGRRWTVAGVKLMIDGTIDNGTAWLDEPDCYGESTASFWLDPDAYTHAVHHLARHGVPTATHAIGDAAVRHVLATLEQAPDCAAGPHRIEHLETVPTELIPRLIRTKAVASMQPTHCSRYTTAEQTDNWSIRLGPERARRGFRCRDLREAGITLALGSDWPVAPYDPRTVMADARLRRPVDRPGTAPVAPEQALTARMALEGYTTHAARAAGDPLSGRIAEGMLADLTAFTVDPLRAEPDELAQAPIAATVLAGTVVHRDPAV